jgi:chemotaxis protein histidine kinase CheA
MMTPLQLDRDRCLAKIKGQIAFLDVAFAALKQADIGEKILAQMHRAVTAIRGALRNADTPELEAFTCDLEDLLGLMQKREVRLTPEIRILLCGCTHALAAAVEALQRGESGEREVQFIRDELFSVLLVNAVTVKR